MMKKIIAPTLVLLLIAIVLVIHFESITLQPAQNAYSPVATATPAPVASNSPITPSPISQTETPVVQSPQANATVHSPLVVSGTVPPGWMFEGVFPIKLVDQNGAILAQAQAHETVAGSWTSGKPVQFLATLQFSINAKNGNLILEKDNPSGLATNAGSFTVPIKF